MKDCRIAISLIALALLALGVGACHRPEDRTPVRHEPPRQTGTLANEAITESSGLAASRSTPGVLWTLNDSKNPPYVYATNALGEDLATCVVDGAENIDWEALAAFHIDGASYLLIADVGDNAARRESLTLYIVPEPSLTDTSPGGTITASPSATIRFSYSDGPHDCEAVSVDPHRREIILISKVMGAAKMYLLPLQMTTPDEPLVARPLAALMLPLVTGMDISPDGRKAIACTYGDAYEFARLPGQTWSEAFGMPPRRLGLPVRPQGEAICYGLDGRTLYLTSERLPAPMWKLFAY